MRKRIFSILLLFILYQFVYPVKSVISIAASEDKQSFFTVTTEESSNDNIKLNIKLNPKIKQDYIEVKLPNQATINQKQLSQEFDKETVVYDKKSNQLNIEKFEESSFSLEINKLNSTDNKVTFIAYLNKKQVEKYEHLFNLEDNKKTNDSITDVKGFLSSDLLEEVVTSEETVSSTSEELLIDSLQDDEIIPFTPRAAITPRAAPTAPNLQRDIRIEPISSTIEAGNDALFKIILKVTGSQVEYKNVKLHVTIPTYNKTTFNQPLSELRIAGVTPTHNKTQNRLEYNFATLKAGQTYETVMKVKTMNGEIPNNRSIGVEGNLMFSKPYDNQNQKTSLSRVTIKSSAEVTTTKEITRITDVNNKLAIAAPNGQIQWRIKVEIPKKSTGQMFLKPGSDIVIKDTLPAGLTYQGNRLVTGTPKAAQSGQTLTWKFKAPSLAEQKNASGNLYSTTLVFWTKINNNNTLIGKTLTNNVKTGNTFIDDKYVEPTSSAKATVKIFDSKGNTGDLKGTYPTPTHFGPKDGFGTRATSGETLNPNPTVHSSQYLSFGHQIAPGPYNQRHNLEELTVIYNIDKNLFLESLYLPPQENWKMGRTKEEALKNIPLPVPVRYDVELTYIRNGQRQTKTLATPKQGKTYSLTDLGLQKGDRVEKVRYLFKQTIPKGLMTNNVFTYNFSIKPGYEGTVKNSFNMVGKSTYNRSLAGNFSDGVQYPFNDRNLFKDLYEGKNEISGDRTAKVVAKKPGGTPITQISIDLQYHQNNVIDTGTNKVIVKYDNMGTSPVSMDKKLEAVILLPPNVKVHSQPGLKLEKNRGQITTKLPGSHTILSQNYNGSGRQLVKVVWNEDYLRPKETLKAEFFINTYKNAPTDLYFDVYGFSGNSTLAVPSGQANNIRKTIKQNDTDDLNKDNDKTRPRIKSSNRYTFLNQYDLKTEKFVKGPNDTGWTKFTKTTPGGKVEYKLHLDNVSGKDLSSMTLIDVLPSGGDLGITDNISRGSKFTPRLTGPIQLPNAWKGKVKVFYSTSKKPKRDDLIRHTDYPVGTTKLGNPAGAENPNWQTQDKIKDWSTIHSFKIELLPGITWIQGQKIDVTFSMQTPTVDQASNKEIFDPTVNKEERAAWNSFAVATDKGQPVEPERVGVYMDEHIGQLTINKVDAESSKTLSGAKFELKKTDGSLTYSLTTDDKGVATLNKIPLGKYQLKEIQAPNGYVLLDKPIDVTITNTTYKVTKTIKNDKKKGNLIIKKIDSSDGKILENAKFEISKKTGERIKTIISDKQGIAKLDNLDLGKYVLKEIEAPSGYLISSEPVEFEITEDNLVFETTIKNDKIPEGDLMIKKIDGKDGKVLANAEFEVMSEDGQYQQTIQTNDEGIAKLEKIPYGKYELKEVKAPDGYTLSEKIWEFEVNEQNSLVELTVKNFKKGPPLPNTGGIGTLIFYAVGGAIMLGGGWLLISSKRRESK